MIYHIPWIYTPVRTVLAIWHQLTKTEIPELAKCSVLMRERSRVEETIYAMQRAGAGSLQVISDFDMTLTRFAHNGKRVATTHNILDNRLLINEDCTKKMRELLNIYYPIEIDASRSVEEKLPLMVEWWTKVHELLIQQKIRKDLLAQAVRESSTMLRDGYKVFFDGLAEHQVPLLIFSAGVGDVLEEVIRQNHVFHPNVHIISNYMDFDHTTSIQKKPFLVCPASLPRSLLSPSASRRPHLANGWSTARPRSPVLVAAPRAAVTPVGSLLRPAVSRGEGQRRLNHSVWITAGSQRCRPLRT
uniref:5'-nucleotidase n=1 Tax=Amphiprion ocellaris TaxID=80972 RepID=A0A3Q1CWW9_AMPOC